MMVRRHGPPPLQTGLAASTVRAVRQDARLRSFAKAQEQAGINKCLLYSYHVCQTAPRHQGWELPCPGRVARSSAPCAQPRGDTKQRSK